MEGYCARTDILTIATRTDACRYHMDDHMEVFCPDWDALLRAGLFRSLRSWRYRSTNLNGCEPARRTSMLILLCFLLPRIGDA